MVTAASFTSPSVQVKNPNTGEVVGQVPDLGAADVDQAIARARGASRRWGAFDHAQRRRDLGAFRRGLAQAAEALATLIHLENGKPKTDAMAEVLLAIQHLSHAAARAPEVLSTRTVSSGLMANFKSTVSYHPLGVIGVIGPWNYPIFTPMGSIAYALAAGNAVVFKPSELTPLVALEVGRIAAETLSVPDLLQVVTGRGATGAALARGAVDKIAFTGSPATGRRVMQAAAERLTPVLLELGGKDPMIVLPDADLDKAAEAAVWGSMSNAGQACVSIERCYVHASIYDRFVDKVVAEAQGVTFGYEGAHIGAITLPAQVDIIKKHLTDAADKGAKFLVGGPDKMQGNVVPPTVMVDVTHDMLVMKEETFGPILPILKVPDSEEALRLANQTSYGLGAAIFGKAHVRELAERIVSGMTTINTVLAFGSVPGLPFGGIGESGFGRIHGDEGLREFSRTKSVVEQRFAIPGMNVFTFKLPANAYEQFKGMAEKLYGSAVLDKASEVLKKLHLR
ncbi:MAG: aldehyde dehydrogenase family protein [Deltaproteobacteria bacterium]|nr:aldehyde dehydrogenase family protein [Deltaproteobacteria bacterium]